jgi:hypothetical protein
MMIRFILIRIFEAYVTKFPNIMKANILIFFLVTLFSCSHKNQDCFESNCLFASGNTSIYDAYFIQNDSDTTHYIITLKAGGGKFLMQNKLKYIVERPSSENNPNHFLSESTTGFIESENRIWLHPPRVDKFKFITQLAPYPEVNLPLKMDDTIEGSIKMFAKWDEWTGHSSDYYLTVEADTTVTFMDNMEGGYLLRGCGVILNDTSCVSYIFSLSKGFIYAGYQNNKGEIFEMKMRSVEIE